MEEKELMENLYNNIHVLISNRGYYIGDVEKAIGVSRGYFSRLAREKYEYKISAVTLYKLSQYFGVSMDNLVSRNSTKLLLEAKVAEIQKEIDGIKSQLSVDN